MGPSMGEIMGSSELALVAQLGVRVGEPSPETPRDSLPVRLGVRVGVPSLETPGGPLPAPMGSASKAGEGEPGGPWPGGPWLSSSSLSMIRMAPPASSNSSVTL